jgi:4-hydroxybenzoate polyprenyltransferase
MGILRGTRHILEMVRFSHTVFALPFALLSAVLAWSRKDAGFSWLELAGILLCMVFARSAAMAFNRLVDRDIDALNPRTAKRHLPAGLLSVSAVIVFLLVCSTGLVAAAALFLWADPPNAWPLIFSVPVLLFVFAYSWTKRFTALAHFWLGASLLLAPLCAWIAIRGMEELQMPLVLGLAVCAWVTGFDIIYACQDVDFDRRAKLHSIPARLGVGRALRIAFWCHIVMLLLLATLYVLASPPLGYLYLAGIGIVAVLVVYQHSLVRPNDLTRVNQAFFNVNAVISIGLFVLVLVEVMLGY